MNLPSGILKFALTALLAFGGFFTLHSASAVPAKLLDLEGRPADPFGDREAKLLAFIFVRTDCPVSNNYAPEIQRLQARFAPSGVVFWLVYPTPDETPDAIRRHLREYRYPEVALRDPRHVFAKRAKVRVTPEAAIFRPDGTLLYHGRIDDRYVDLGKARPKATRHEFADALALALAGKPVPPAAGPAVGCFIEDVNE